jgi:hypothetical protein
MQNNRNGEYVHTLELIFFSDRKIASLISSTSRRMDHNLPQAPQQTQFSYIGLTKMACLIHMVPREIPVPYQRMTGHTTEHADTAYWVPPMDRVKRMTDSRERLLGLLGLWWLPNLDTCRRVCTSSTEDGVGNASASAVRGT